MARSSDRKPNSEDDTSRSASPLVILAGRIHGSGEGESGTSRPLPPLPKIEPERPRPEIPAAPSTQAAPKVSAEAPALPRRPLPNVGQSRTRDELLAASEQFHRINNARLWRMRFMAIGGPYIVFLFLLTAGGYMGYRFYRHEQWVQAMKIYETRIAEINAHKVSVNPKTDPNNGFLPASGTAAMPETDSLSVRQAILNAEQLRAQGHTVQAIIMYHNAADVLDGTNDTSPQVLAMRVALHNRIGVLFGNMGHYRESAAEFQNAKRLSPKDPNVARNYGLALIGVARKGSTNQNYKPAIEALQEAVKLDSSNAASHRALATALRLAGEFDAAALENEAANKIGPPPAPAAAEPVQEPAPAASGGAHSDPAEAVTGALSGISSSR